MDGRLGKPGDQFGPEFQFNKLKFVHSLMLDNIEALISGSAKPREALQSFIGDITRKIEAPIISRMYEFLFQSMDNIPAELSNLAALLMEMKDQIKSMDLGKNMLLAGFLLILYILAKDERIKKKSLEILKKILFMENITQEYIDKQSKDVGDFFYEKGPKHYIWVESKCLFLIFGAMSSL